MEKIVFATNNKNKLKEIQHLLDGIVEVVSLADVGFDEDIEETELTLEGNALLKARAINDKCGYSVFADDTGLEIDALGGEPGVFSARYAGEPSNAENNINKVLQKLDGVSNRKAQFRTVIALIENEEESLFEGIVKGDILSERHGSEGFGYDPIFRPNGYAETFAQLPMSLKNEISHRGLAVKKLVAFLKK